MGHDTETKVVSVEATTDAMVEIVWKHPRSGRAVTHAYVHHREEASEVSALRSRVQRLERVAEAFAETAEAAVTAHRAPKTEGRANRTFGSFKCRKSEAPLPGYRVLQGGDPPRLIELGLMSPTRWRHVSGKGDSATYEKEGGS